MALGLWSSVFELCALIFDLCALYFETLVTWHPLEHLNGSTMQKEHQRTKYKAQSSKTKGLRPSPHSKEIRSAAEVAQGAKVIDSTVSALSRYKCD